MEVLFHFIFELIKISVLGCIYASLTVIIFKTIAFFKPESWFKRVSQNKKRLWFRSGFIISVGLFIFLFTYWGNHGLGDQANVPVGHFKTVGQINGNMAYIKDNNEEPLTIDKFTFDNQNVYAEINQQFINRKEKYVIWDLENDTWALYTKEEYLKKAELNNYPKPDSFEDFHFFYKKRWGGLWFWLLP